MATRVGVDVGGTFTDLVYYDDASGAVLVGKEPTTPQAPEEGVLAAVAAAVPEGHLARARYFLHGTTVGLNSLVTRTGAVVGLLATRGFRDILEMGRGDRRDPYDLFWRQPPPLVPRRLRRPVTERTDASGAILEAIHRDDIRTALELFGDAGVDSVAIAFINAYANPENELQAMRLLRELGFEGDISPSHRVSGEYREYERTSTTVIDAYVRPRMRGYLSALEGRLEAAGFGGVAIVTRAGGGASTFAQASERPFETIMSGPVAGAEGAAAIARRLDLPAVITADVGGTTFDTCLIVGGRPQLMYEGEVEGMPVQAPWTDVRSIGAGGGSIAEVDVGGLLTVGPGSAGSTPGPACYGRGGTEATVTDAAFVLGMLGEGELASGIHLDRTRAVAAISPLAGKLGYTVERTAEGIMTIASAAMAGAIRSITIERGHDPREAVLMPFGGAGPLFATLLARELETGRIVVPPYAGNFSAWGLLSTDLTESAARTRLLTLDDAAIGDINVTLEELFASMSANAGAPAGAACELGLDMRFLGQEHSLTVTMAGAAVQLGAGEIRDRFRAQYAGTYGHVLDDAVEVVSVRATRIGRLPELEPSAPDSGPVRRSRSLPAWSFARRTHLPFRLLARDGVPPGGIEGPAILVEDTTTIYVDADFGARPDADGVLHITALGAG